MITGASHDPHRCRGRARMNACPRLRSPPVTVAIYPAIGEACFEIMIHKIMALGGINLS